MSDLSPAPSLKGPHLASVYGLAPSSRPALPLDTPPSLAVVVDTEEEFDWSAPFDRSSRGVGSIAAQARAQEIYAKYALAPTYVCDACVVEDDAAVATLAAFAATGEARIGTHLHPWVSRPYEETVSAPNSFQCNLPPDLERAKLTGLTEAIAERFGARPTVFKAGRYGFGADTLSIIRDLGYEIDCSFVPYTDFGPMHGPSFTGAPAEPFWLDREGGVLEVPLSRGFAGFAAPMGPAVQGAVDRDWFRTLKVGGVLSKLGALERVTLTPEGVSAEDQIRLVDALLGQGVRVFTITYHSPSLEPGHTPYVRDGADLRAFLQSLEKVCAYFADLPDARFVTLEDLRADAIAALSGAGGPGGEEEAA